MEKKWGDTPSATLKFIHENYRIWKIVLLYSVSIFICLTVENCLIIKLILLLQNLLKKAMKCTSLCIRPREVPETQW